MEHVKLNNGLPVPLLGYGVFKLTDEETENAVREALHIGYRLIDTAQIYGNEAGVGRGIKSSGVERSEVFVTTKIWISDAGDRKAAHAIDESLRRLDTDYIDLLLIHQPFGDYYGTWRAMESALITGKVRAVGVSNFSAGRFVDLAVHAKVLPAVDQLETHVFAQQCGADELLGRFDARIMAWAPLAQGNSEFFEHPVLTDIARRHGKSVAQVALRWLTQRGIIAIPKSVRPERMRENFEIFDFKLSDDELQRIAALNRRDRGTRDFDDPDYVKRMLSLAD